MSDWTIRVFYGSVDKAPQHKRDLNKDIYQTRGEIGERRKYAICERKCDTPGPRMPAKTALLGLPSVCRQLNAETKMLPFTLNNEFVLETKQCLPEFCRRLGVAQRALVTDLRLLLVADKTTGLYSGRPQCRLSIIDPNKALVRLLGLKMVVFEVYCYRIEVWNEVPDKSATELCTWTRWHLFTAGVDYKKDLSEKTVEFQYRPAGGGSW
jgi:hypothetical protein